MEERGSVITNSKDAEEPAKKAKHHCCMQEVPTSHTKSPGLRYSQPARYCPYTTLFFLQSSGKESFVAIGTNISSFLSVLCTLYSSHDSREQLQQLLVPALAVATHSTAVRS